MTKETSNHPLQKSSLKPTLVSVFLTTSLLLSCFSLSFAEESAKSDSQEGKQLRLVNTQTPNGKAEAPFKMSAAHEGILENYCFDCHDDATQKGNVRLDNLASLTLTDRLNVFNKIQEQVYLKHMPPKKKDQPTDEERDSVFKWVSVELDMHQASHLAEKLSKPHYANYVDHEKLFSGEIKDEAFSPARLWRRSPYQFDNSIRTVFGVHSNPKATVGEVDKLKQPFNKGGGEGISDYASLFYADSATFDTLHRNAVFIIDSTLMMAFIEMDYKSQGKTMVDWNADRAKVIKEQADVIAQMIKDGKNPRYVRAMHGQINQKYSLKTPQVYSDIILGDGKPTKEMMEAAIKYHFERTIQQEASQEDLTKFTDFMQQGIEESGPYFGLRNALIAVLCSPKFIYRSELGLGKALDDGRTMLSSTELAYAISYALTDEKPDKILTEAAKNGQLNTREDVEREVTRMLNDKSIDKPRILRFFQEFFGYHNATEVFKDDIRFHKGYTSSNLARNYVNDTDVLIKYILNKDKDVFKELLSTEEYFVGHSGDNEDFKNTALAHQKLYAYFKDKNWKNYSKSAKKKEQPTKEDIEYVLSLHSVFRDTNSKLKDGDAIYSRMKYLEPFYEKGINPFTYRVYRGTDAQFNSLYAYNLPGKQWNAPVEQPFVLAKGKRAGILSHPSWLIAHSLNSHTDPVRRGKWIREYLLAGTIPDVPITVDATIPENHDQTLRERYSVTEATKCWGCHVQMNPLGYPFEVFDDFGRWREMENMEGLPKVKNTFETRPINSKGYLEGTGDEKLDGEVENAYELINRLADSRKVQQSFIRHTFRYWMGRNELLTDSKTLIRAEKAYMDNEGSFNALLISLITSDSFIYRKRLNLEQN